MNKYEAFLRKMVELRDSMGYSQENVADGAKFERTAYSRREKGEIKVTVADLIRIADFYGISAAKFFEDIGVTSSGAGKWQGFVDRLIDIFESDDQISIAALQSNIIAFHAAGKSKEKTNNLEKENIDLKKRIEHLEQILGYQAPPANSSSGGRGT